MKKSQWSEEQIIKILQEASKAGRSFLLRKSQYHSQRARECFSNNC